MTGIIKVDDLKDAGGNSIISSNGSGTLTYTFNAGSIARAALAADIIDGTKLADDAINSEHYTDGSIDLAHMSVNSIDSDQYVDGSIDLAHMSSQSVDEDNLHISNSPTNGYALTAQSGNAGGLTWADISTSTATIKAAFPGIDDTSSSFDDCLTITDNEIVINEDGDNQDFRVESDDQANFFFCDASANIAGFSLHDRPDLGFIHITTASSGASSVLAGADELVIEGSGDSGMTILSGTGDSGRVAFADSGGNDRGIIDYMHGTDAMKFVAAGAERMRMPSDTGSSDTGGLWIGTTSGTDTGLTVEKDEDGWFLEYLRNTSNTGSDTHMCYWHFVNVAHDNTTDDFLRARDSSTNRCKIKSDGDLQNHDNSYGSTSDERIKQDITDSGSQWDDVKAMRVRKYKKKDDVRQYGENAWEQIGLIAQELEAASMDKLVRENLPDSADVLSSSEFGVLYTEQDKTDGLIPTNNVVGDVKTVSSKVKSIGYSVVHMKALKALQEAQTRIETLEAKVAVLEG